MSTRPSAGQVLVDVDEAGHAASGSLRIGEAAKTCGVTTRTLRYWQEIGLLTPGGHREGGERLYTGAEVERAARIKELQGLLGFSLSEIRQVLEIEDNLDRLRSAYRASASPDNQLRFVTDAIDANEKLLARLEDAFERIKTFRDETATRTRRLHRRAKELEAEMSKSAADVSSAVDVSSAAEGSQSRRRRGLGGER